MKPQHDAAMEVVADHMRKANDDRKVALRLFDARFRRLAKNAMPSEFSWMKRHCKSQIDYKDAVLKHSFVETEVNNCKLKSDAKDFKLKFLKRENARLRRLVPALQI